MESLDKYSERRTHPRYPCYIRLDDSRTIRDLSLGGAFVEGPAPVSGPELALEFALPNPPRLIGAKGKVVFSGGGRYGQGFGVQFVDLDLSTKALLQLYLHHLDRESEETAKLRTRFIAETEDLLKNLPEELQTVRGDFKMSLCDFRAYLQSLKGHLERTESIAKNLPIMEREPLLSDLIDLYEEEFQRKTHQFILDVSGIVSTFDPQEHAVHRRYFQTVLSDLTNDSAFFKRATEKPLGYAGDFLMMELLYKGLRSGDTLWNRVVNSCLTSIPLGQAVRNRAWYLRDWIDKTTSGVENPRIMSLACGPCEEVRLFAKHSPKRAAEFYLVDQDPQALAYAKAQMAPFQEKTSSRFHFRQDSTRSFLKDQQHAQQFPAFHLIYSAGLFDYLKLDAAAALTSVLYGMLEPGGTLVIGNFVKDHPFGYFIEYASDWFLHHRTEQDMLSLAPPEVLKEHQWVEREPSGVNLFLCIRKLVRH